MAKGDWRCPLLTHAWTAVTLFQVGHSAYGRAGGQLGAPGQERPHRAGRGVHGVRPGGGSDQVHGGNRAGHRGVLQQEGQEPYRPRRRQLQVTPIITL
eukprot:2637378-Pyramimonas_sp.AAC.1